MALTVKGAHRDKNDSPTSTSSLQDVSHTRQPLDLSFKCLISVMEVRDEILSHNHARMRKSRQSGKYSCNAIRVNNNTISDLSGFVDALKECIDDVNDISWLDLSFNEFKCIHPELTEFKNLKMLYLHGNGIENLNEIDKLASLPKLMNLTLHGNPIESDKGYRQYVVATLPGLKTFDFGAVTAQDRTTARTWKSINLKTRHSTSKKKKSTA